MSQVKISGDPSGSGIFTISAPNSSTNRALVLPDSAGTMATAESTLAQFNVSGSAPVFAARAWVNFNGTGTPAIRASGNVSSITDNGVGDFTLNFATAMPDASYSVGGYCMAGTSGGSGYVLVGNDFAPAAGSCRVGVGDISTGARDVAFVMFQVFR